MMYWSKMAFFFKLHTLNCSEELQRNSNKPQTICREIAPKNIHNSNKKSEYISHYWLQTSESVR